MKKLISTLKAKLSSTPTLTTPPSFIHPTSFPGPAEDSTLEILYEGEIPAIDIVAIHGQNGSPTSSWTDRATGTFWLRDLLPKTVPNSRIMTFGYLGKDSSIAVAQNLLHKVVEIRADTNAENRTLIWLAHSFGGSILKAALGTSRSKHRSPYLKDPHLNILSPETKSILFFGVPTNGDGISNLLASFSPDHKGEGAMSEEIRILKRDLTWLQDRHGSYEKIRGDIITKYFMESAGHDQKPKLDTDEVIHLSKTHGQMIQFPNEEDEDWKKVRAVLLSVVGN